MATAPLGSSAQAQLIVDHLVGLDVTDLDLWQQLDALSTHTRVEGVEVPPEGVVVDRNGQFTAVLNLYVSLEYGGGGDEGFTTSDSFLARIKGHMDGNLPVIDGSTVDTSSFYE